MSTVTTIRRARTIAFCAACLLALVSLPVGLSAGTAPLTGPGLTSVLKPAGGYWDADLGIPLIHASRAFVLLGDVIAQPHLQRTPNAVGEVVGVSVKWAEDENRLATPFFPLLGMSTVPSGGVVIADAVYVYMMNVSDWGSGAPGAVTANGLIAAGTVTATGPLEFSHTPAAVAPASVPLVNAAPLLTYSAAEGWWVYVYGTGRYRDSAVYLARTLTTAVTSLDQYQWWTGSTWVTGHSDAAVPLPLQGSPSSVGELSVAFDLASKLYVLCFFNYESTYVLALVCQSAPGPTGPWGTAVTLMTGDPQPWYESGWCCPYGGYFQAPTFNSTATGRLVNLVVSLWVPYRSFVVPFDFSPVLGV